MAIFLLYTSCAVDVCTFASIHAQHYCMRRWTPHVLAAPVASRFAQDATLVFLLHHLVAVARRVIALECAIRVSGLPLGL